MKKIYIFLGAGVIVLVSLIIIISLTGKSKNPKSKTTNYDLPPTTYPLQPTPYALQNNIQDIQPIETADFFLSYSPSLNKVEVIEKTANAKQGYYDWAYQNNYPQLVEDESLTSFTTSAGGTVSEKKSGGEVLIDFLNIFMNFGQGNSSSNNNQTSNFQLPNQSSSVQLPASNFTYYYQCGEYGSYSLPSGCTLCTDGCGPTTVAMIAASYVDKNITPQTIVDLYKNRSYLLGCGGSRYSDAKTALENYGLKTTSYMVYNFETANQVVNDFRNYIDSGWTLFTLVNLCQGGCGHFFWITDIDSQGNILAYDPFYGSTAIPYNENSRSPYPLYRLAFGVKK